MRRVLNIPLPKGPLRTVICTDMLIDDIHAITYALLYPERFQIEGFVGSNIGEGFRGELIGPDGPKRNVLECQNLLEKMGFRGRYPVKRGSDPLYYTTHAQESEGADFIVKQALAKEKGPLYVVVLGPASDIASAFLKKPSIKDNVIVVFHSRSQFWPDKAWNMNIFNDLKAVQVILRSELPLIYFDTGTTLRMSNSESEENIKPCGEIGEYLHHTRVKREDQAVYDVGDIAFLINHNWCKWEKVHAPDMRVDYTYNFTVNNGPIIRVYDVDRNAVFSDFYDRLRAFASKRR